MNSSEIEVTDWILKYYLDELVLSSDIQPTFCILSDKRIVKFGIQFSIFSVELICFIICV
jgi:hypothetical protein